MSVRSCLVPLLGGGLLALPVLLAAGCGGQTTPGSSNEGKDASCTELCEQAAECGAEMDVSACEESCTDNEVVSRAGQELLTECTTSDECEQISILGTVACLEDGLFDLPITEAQEDFCRITLGDLAECGGRALGDGDIDACLSGAALLADEFITELGECTERRSCDLVNVCAGLKVLTAVDEDQLQALLDSSAAMGDLGGLGALEDLLGSLPDLTGMGGAGPN
jgi:hypothetical protein